MDSFFNTLAHLTGLQLTLLLLVIPLMFFFLLIGWMLLVARGQQSTAMRISGLGVSLGLTASRVTSEPPPQLKG